ncbi:MAG TPA: DivIVA domain-containing protein [Bacilli bacterium]|nr:DivIVA domain-containing protein [Bacilli bacterium]
MKKFNTSLTGYDKKEVNTFVNDITKEYESMLNNLKDRDKEINDLREKLSRFENMENTLNRAILVAEDASNRIKKMAYEESNTIVSDAKKNASRIINEALIKAEHVESETIFLKRKVANYKKRIKQEIENQLEIVDSMDEVIDD